MVLLVYLFCFSEFYEDILSIICTCTCFEISESMWSVFYMLYEAFQRDAFDYFAGNNIIIIIIIIIIV